jgi:hypothetical protein
MDNDKKLVHVRIINGNSEDFKMLGMALKDLKAKLGWEFIVTDENVQLTSAKWLMNELWELLKQYKKVKEKKEAKDGTDTV